jgi:hypothetical protein
MPKALCVKPFRTKGDPVGGYFEAIAAEEFCLVDKKGNIRAVLSLNEDRQPRLLLFDNNEKLRLSFYIEEGQPGIELLDTNEKTRAALGLGDNGQPALLLLDKEEKVQASLEMGEDGGPGLDLYDPAGELRASLALFGDDDSSNLVLIDKDGKRRKTTKSGEGTDEQPLLVLYDKDGEPCDMLGGEYDEGSA